MTANETLYRPLDFYIVRAPLLPVEAHASSASSGFHELGMEVRRALAVGSLAAYDALATGRSGSGARRRGRSERTLSRYIIRMSTRPTPFGLFGGVALGRWQECTDLRLASAPRRTRTRPDMGWLMNVVSRLESVPAIRRQLRVVANHAGLMRAGRIVLSERMPTGDGSIPPAVSIRATTAARLALDIARTPIHYEQLTAALLEQIDGATRERVERLLTELWQQTFLLTELRPPLTGGNAVQHVLETLDGIPEAAETCAQLRSVAEAAAEWDASPLDRAADQFHTMTIGAKAVEPYNGSPFQVDSSLGLLADGLPPSVANEVCRAAEVLLRLAQNPYGPPHLASYRRAFQRRYGPGREVPLLELVDPETGLGLPWAAQQGTTPLTNQGRALGRRETLMAIAAHALRDRQRVVTLDETTVQRLELADLSMCELPTSLELAVSIAAESNESIDAGQFCVVISPTVGSQAAGRTLGRFADLVPGATAALECAARAEQDLRPDLIWAELVFQPHSFRLGNVSTRPNVRPYEIVVGVTAGRVPAETIPLDELMVGVRDDRFYIRWPAAGRDVAITATHMLTHRRAPAVCRALFELSLDRCCLLTQFQWESVSGFPFLPRVQVGRVVISLARWRLRRDVLPDAALQDTSRFAALFGRWCDEWQVPRRVYLRPGDQRLLLDLTIAAHVDELRREIARLPAGGAVVISEVFPDFDEAWTRNADGLHFMTEFVVPLVRRTPSEHERRCVASGHVARPVRAPSAFRREAPSQASPRRWLRPPGSDWIFAKLYCVKSVEDELIVGPLRRFADDARTSGLVSKWFFLRYSDPDRHVRIRFNGTSERLMTELVPSLCSWASELVDKQLCDRFALDTYEREIQRFGGDDAMAAVECWFAEDSYVVADCLELLSARGSLLPLLPVAVLTVDALLDGLGVDAFARAHWCRQHVRSRTIAGEEYRQWKAILRPIVAAGDERKRQFVVPGLDRILGRVRTAGSVLRQDLVDLEARRDLTRPLAELIPSFVHLHLNRLTGDGSGAEERILGLLWRVRQGLHRAGSRRQT